MDGVELRQALEALGYSVYRRSGPYVWLRRGARALMLQEDITVDAETARHILADASGGDAPETS